MRRTVAVLFFLIFTVGCRSEGDIIRHGKIENIVRVFMTAPNEYAFLVKNLETGEMSLKILHNQHRLGEKKIIADVPAGNLMWIEYREAYTDQVLSPKSFLHIHVYSEDSIEGGGWKERVGKHYEDRTTAVVR